MPRALAEILKSCAQLSFSASTKKGRSILGIAFAVLALLTFGSPAPALDSIKTYAEAGYRAYVRGDMPQAEQNFRSAAHQALRRRRETWRYPSCLVYLAKVSFKEGRMDDAESYLRQALRIYRKSWGDDHFLIAAALRELAPVLRQRGNTREAASLEAQAESIFSKPAKLPSTREVRWLSGPGIAPFYRKAISASGIQIMSSSSVSPEALVAAAEIVEVMLRRRPDVRDRLSAAKARVAIIGMSEVTTDIPEYRHKKGLPTPDGRDRDRATRGQGGSILIPVTSAAEENLMFVPSDLYLGTCILVHEFAHAILSLGLTDDERAKIGLAFENAKKLGRWANTYASSNIDEYFAEATTSFFNANQRPDPGVHNGVKTRAQLKAYDPEIYTILDRIFAPPR